MSWRIAEHPEGGMMIEHLDAPRFTARWTTGAFPLSAAFEGGFFWTDQGAGEEDTIVLHAFAWIDPSPTGGQFERLMRAAALAIEGRIVGRF